jgi:hypothetical protein
MRHDIVTSYEMDGRILIFGRGKDFSLLHLGIQTGCNVHTALCSVDTEDAFRDIKRMCSEADHVTAFSI